MKIGMPIIIFAVTALLIAVAMFNPGSATVQSAAPNPSDAPERAINNFLIHVQQRHWNQAYSELANTDDVSENLLAKNFGGSHGSLRVFSSLQNWDFQPLHRNGNEAQVRVTLHWSTPVGVVNDVHDVKVQDDSGNWKVSWPIAPFPEIATQVLPVNYLRWDLVSASSDKEWGQGNLDSPHVRIVSMNAIEYEGNVTVMGEVLNEDTVPAFVNVAATLVGNNGQDLDEESSFDKMAHVLLPKQVSPYRIDFPGIALSRVKSVRMNAKATLVPASADPVIGVMDQKIQSDPQGHAVLVGKLLNQTGEIVNIPHVIASFYDSNGRVVWVSDGYVNRVLFPQAPQSFSIEIPRSIAGKVQSYHVVVNQYSLNAS